MSANKIQIDKIEPIEITVTYSEVDKNTALTHREMHMHEEYEIYVNIEGEDVLELNGRFCTIPNDAVVVIKPYEGHRCIFRSEGIHKHFWILLKTQNEFMNTLFENGEESNIIHLEEDSAKELIKCLYDLSLGKKTRFEHCIAVFNMLNIMKKGKSAGLPEESDSLPADVVRALEYMEKHINKKIDMRLLAKESLVSINTLERHFKEHLQISPSAALKRKRLMTAAKLLSHGMSVSETCEKSGFTDYSNFITTFRSFFGITPLKYQKSTKR